MSPTSYRAAPPRGDSVRLPQAVRSVNPTALPRHGSVDPFLPALPLGLAEDELLDLAGRGLGEVAEGDGGRALEVRELLSAELQDLGLGGFHSRLEGHERLGTLAPLLVGDG